MVTLKTGFVIISLSFFALSCGAFKTKKTGQKQRQNDIRLAGVWNSNCTKGDWLGLSSEKEVLTFNAIGDLKICKPLV